MREELAPYQTTKVTPEKYFTCPHCKSIIGREIITSWYHKRRDRMIDSKVLYYYVRNRPIKIYVRAELPCFGCGKEVVWCG